MVVVKWCGCSRCLVGIEVPVTVARRRLSNLLAEHRTRERVVTSAVVALSGATPHCTGINTIICQLLSAHHDTVRE
ncbi:unnamed protein product [Arctia plantaginis]|uniref:Uncharacterized protein n=1 Tax=Arctia plantaginis TaxID=874455 RepID=A0A8S0YL75_ARCPL|nr:unnamed protein product [Arctia plantaginis]